MSRKYVNMNTREDSRPQWVKISEVAAMYGTKPQTVRSWIRKGLLKQTGIGRRLHYVTAESLQTFKEGHDPAPIPAYHPTHPA